MKTISRYIMTLALLLTAVGGAWADGDTKYNVTFKANGNTKTVENVTLPKTFSCNVDDETGRGTDELDVIIQELYGLSGNYCLNTAPNSDNASVTCGMDDADLQYIIVNAPFNGTATVTGKYIDTNYSVFDYSLEITLAEAPIEVTTNAASKQDLFTTASFKMPASDVTVNYTLVRDLMDDDTENAVHFTGLPADGTTPIVVKKGSDGKYQPIEALTIQLIDPLAAAEAQNIIAADGITIKVLVGAENELGAIEFDQEPPITLEAFLADMKPGYYWIWAEASGDDSPYDGTAFSSQFTVVEKYDLTVKPANDFSKGKVESVTVGTETIAPNANGKASKTGIDPETEVKIKAKRGYVIDKVEAKKKVPAEGHALTSAKFGEIVGSDGKAYAADDKDNLPSGVTAVAMICYVSGSHGLALALTDEGKMNWSTAQTTCAAHTPAITGGTWKLASKDEWNSMISAAGSDADLRDGFGFVGGTNMQSGIYWSSTEYEDNSSQAYYYDFYGGYYNVFSKGNNARVRACLAF